MKHLFYYFALVALFFALQSCSFSKKINRAKNKIDNIVKQYPELKKDSLITINDTIITSKIYKDTIISCDSLRHYIQQFSNGNIQFIPVNNTEYRVITRIEPDTIIKKHLATFQFIESQNNKLYKELTKTVAKYNKLQGENSGLHEYYKQREKQFKIYRNYFFLIIFVLVVYATYRIYNRVTKWNVAPLLKNMLKL